MITKSLVLVLLATGAILSTSLAQGMLSENDIAVYKQKMALKALKEYKALNNINLAKGSNLTAVFIPECKFYLPINNLPAQFDTIKYITIDTAYGANVLIKIKGDIINEGYYDPPLFTFSTENENTEYPSKAKELRMILTALQYSPNAFFTRFLKSDPLFNEKTIAFFKNGRIWFLDEDLNLYKSFARYNCAYIWHV